MTRMDRVEAQRVLHDWSPWVESVRRAQRDLDYDPTWYPGTPNPTDTSSDYARWVATNRRQLDRLAGEECARLGLADDGHRRYWRACFLSWRMGAAIETIVEPDRHLGVAASARALPPLQTLIVRVVEGEGPAMVVLEGPLALVTSGDLDVAKATVLRWQKRVGPRHELIGRRRAAPAIRGARAKGERTVADIRDELARGTPKKDLAEAVDREERHVRRLLNRA